MTFLPQVEVNLLTGETTILRSDIIYDCGQSLNPAVDLGQVSHFVVIFCCFHLDLTCSRINNCFCRLKEPSFKELVFLCMRNTQQIQKA